MSRVDELMKKYFDDMPWRIPRSDEYKAGVRAVLEYRINGVRVICLYTAVVQEDAFAAGCREGHDRANQEGIPHRHLSARIL